MVPAIRLPGALLLVAVAACNPTLPPSAAPSAVASIAATATPSLQSPAQTSTVAPIPSAPSPAFPLDPTVFTTLPPLLEARFEHTATMLSDGRLFVVGGRYLDLGSGDSDRYFRSVEIYDPASRTWAAGPAMQRARSGHSATLLRDGRLLVAGGDVRADGSMPDPALEIFDPQTNAWTLISGVPIIPSGAITLQDGRVLLPGFMPASSSNKSYSTLFDPRTGRFGSVTRIAGVSLYPGATLLLDGRVLAAGGWRGYGDGPPEARAEAAIFDPATGAWSPVASMLHARGPASIVTLADGRALIVSERSGELYNPSTDTWTRTGGTASFRDGTALVPMPDGRIAAIGSESGNIESLPIIEVFDPGAGSWSTLTSFRVMDRLTATLLHDGSILIAGGLLECRFGQACENQRVVGDAFLLNPSSPS
jgi:hypothetical protein